MGNKSGAQRLMIDGGRAVAFRYTRRGPSRGALAE